MSSGLYTHTTRAVGTILTAAIYNADHQNHITNQNPAMTGALSDTLTEYRSTADPGGSGSEVLAGSLAGELQRLRYVISRIVGKTYWYEAPATNLESVGDADITAIAALSGTGILVRTGSATWAVSYTLPATTRLNPRVVSTASSATPTPDADITDQYELTALAAAATFGAPTGTPVAGQKLVIRIKDNNTARALTWNAAFRAGTEITLPTTTVQNKTMYLGFIYNATDSKWDIVAKVDNI